MREDLELSPRFLIRQSTIHDLLKEYLGRPFSKDFDCWVFIKEIWGRLGYSFTEDFPFGGIVDDSRFVYFEDWDRVSVGDRLDVLLLKKKKRYHCGLMLNMSSFVHCRYPVGVAIDSLTETWKPFVVGFYRLKNGRIRTNN